MVTLPVNAVPDIFNWVTELLGNFAPLIYVSIGVIFVFWFIELLLGMFEKGDKGISSRPFRDGEDNEDYF